MEDTTHVTQLGIVRSNGKSLVVWGAPFEKRSVLQRGSKIPAGTLVVIKDVLTDTCPESPREGFKILKVTVATRRDLANTISIQQPAGSSVYSQQDLVSLTFPAELQKAYAECPAYLGFLLVKFWRFTYVSTSLLTQAFSQPVPLAPVHPHPNTHRTRCKRLNSRNSPVIFYGILCGEEWVLRNGHVQEGTFIEDLVVQKTSDPSVLAAFEELNREMRMHLEIVTRYKAELDKHPIWLLWNRISPDQQSRFVDGDKCIRSMLSISSAEDFFFRLARRYRQPLSTQSK